MPARENQVPSRRVLVTERIIPDLPVAGEGADHKDPFFLHSNALGRNLAHGWTLMF
jgi:hypothetical protein